MGSEPEYTYWQLCALILEMVIFMPLEIISLYSTARTARPSTQLGRQADRQAPRLHRCANCEVPKDTDAFAQETVATLPLRCLRRNLITPVRGSLQGASMGWVCVEWGRTTFLAATKEMKELAAPLLPHILHY